MSPVTLLTGRPGTGKTTHCRRMMHVDGVVGLVCPACEIRSGERYGIDTLCFSGNDNPERVPLARVRETEFDALALKYPIVQPPDDDDFSAAQLKEEMTVQGPFHFSPSAMERCNRFLEGLLHSNKSRLIIVDEVGPLEMDAQGGLSPALTKLLSSSVALLLVVRPTLVVRVHGYIQTYRPDAVIETITTTDLPNPRDRRILNFLT